MCLWKKKPDSVIMTPAKRRITSLGRNLYGGQDLSGCWNDTLNLTEKTQGMFSDFDLRKFRDYDCTADRYLAEFEGGIKNLAKGGTVLVMADSCFSETITRYGMALFSRKHPTKNRFYNPDLPQRKVINKVFSGPVTNHIVMSGCKEHETAADAYINGKYYGAFTFFAVLTLQKGMTYLEWFNEIRRYLPSQDFTQTPTIEGPDYLLNRKVFEDDTFVMHNSSHGSFTYDKNGDEADGQDEGIYLDRLLIDDEIGECTKLIIV